MNSAEMKYSLIRYYRFKRAFHIIASEVELSKTWKIADVMFCDQNDYISEIEIKISIADLLADFSKKKVKHYYMEKGMSGVNKFYFAVPRDILEKTKTVLHSKPDFYGLLCVDDLQYCTDWVAPGNIEIVKKAKWINREKNTAQKNNIIRRMSSELSNLQGKLLLKGEK